MPQTEALKKIFESLRIVFPDYENISTEMIGIALRRAVVRKDIKPAHIRLILSSLKTEKLRFQALSTRCKKKGMTALHYALRDKRWELAICLIKNCKKSLLIASNVNETPLQNILFYLRNSLNVKNKTKNINTFLSMVHEIRNTKLNMMLTEAKSDDTKQSYIFPFTGKPFTPSVDDHGDKFKKIPRAHVKKTYKEPQDKKRIVIRNQLDAVAVLHDSLKEKVKQDAFNILRNIASDERFYHIIYNYLTGDSLQPNEHQFSIYYHNKPILENIRFPLTTFRIESYLRQLSSKLNKEKNLIVLPSFMQQDTKELNACGFHALASIDVYSMFFSKKILLLDAIKKIRQVSHYKQFSRSLEKFLDKKSSTADREISQTEISHLINKIYYFPESEEFKDLFKHPKQLALAHEGKENIPIFSSVTLVSKDIKDSDTLLTPLEKLSNFATLFNINHLMVKLNNLVHPVLVGYKTLSKDSKVLEGHYVAVWICASNDTVELLASNSWVHHDNSYLAPIISLIQEKLIPFKTNDNLTELSLKAYDSFLQSTDAKCLKSIKDLKSKFIMLRQEVLSMYINLLMSMHRFMDYCQWRNSSNPVVKIHISELFDLVMTLKEYCRTRWFYQETEILTQFSESLKNFKGVLSANDNKNIKHATKIRI